MTTQAPGAEAAGEASALFGRGQRARTDAEAKATGRAVYAGDISRPGMAHVAVARSTMPSAAITSIDTARARASEGVIAVFSADDVSARNYGRGVKDVPLLARDRVRYVGERVVAVVAETRRQAEAAAELVEIDYEPLEAVTSTAEALAPGAPHVHESPWDYPGAVAREEDGRNLMYHRVTGSLAEFEAAYDAGAYRVDRTYTTQGVHQGYLEPQACIVEYRSPDDVQVWMTTKMPYPVRGFLADFAGIAPDAITLHGIAALGGDFGAKGGPQEAPLCLELSRLVGRPIKSVLRYNEELTATSPRHPSTVRVRICCDRDYRLCAVAIEAVANGGAYAGLTPAGAGPQGFTNAPSYRVPVVYSELSRVYTNTVPRGSMRAPGAPQGLFGFESAIDELALEAGIDPIELRRRNLLGDGEANFAGARWHENRGELTLDGALTAFEAVPPPPGWLYGRGLAVFSHVAPTRVQTSLRLVPLEDGCMRVETPFIETGTGSHTVLREMIAAQLGYRQDDVEVVTVGTDAGLPRDSGPGGSRATTGFSIAVDIAAKAWVNRERDEPVVVDVDEEVDSPLGSYTVVVAQVAVDPETGEVRVLELLTAHDVAQIVHPLAHQMQIDGGVAMGYGFAMLEDLDESGGQVWAANLGEFKLPSARDVPPLRTVLVAGGRGVGTANVKSVGESTTPPVAPAIANALYAATGIRIRDLPIRAEKVRAALRGHR